CKKNIGCRHRRPQVSVAHMTDRANGQWALGKDSLGILLPLVSKAVEQRQVPLSVRVRGHGPVHHHCRRLSRQNKGVRLCTTAWIDRNGMRDKLKRDSNRLTCGLNPSRNPHVSTAK